MAAGYQLVTGAWSADDESDKSVTAVCPAGKVVIGGGFETGDLSNDSEVVILSSYPTGAAWVATGTLDSAAGNASYSLRAFAICVTA